MVNKQTTNITDELLEKVGNNLPNYLKGGKLNLNSFTQKIDPNLNINKIEKLLRIHFVLTKKKDVPGEVGVIDFVKDLSTRIRKLKTTITPKNEVLKGRVKGKIKWNETFKERGRTNPSDKTLFVCSQQEKLYDTSENIVLKKIISIIHNIIYEDLKPAFENNYNWLNEWIYHENSLKTTLEQLYYKNPYLKRISLDKKITSRTISKVKKSRKPIYREAAQLLEKYYKLQEYQLDENEAKNLLRNTFIAPEKSEVLFELYWIIKILENIGSHSLEIIEPVNEQNNLVAKWKIEEYRYEIYHDVTADMIFLEKKKDYSHLKEQDDFFSRQLLIHEKLGEMTNRDSNTLWRGRPDIVIKKINANEKKLSDLFIGEVKFTKSEDYAIQGLRELLEYIALVKDKENNNKYFVEKDKLFNEECIKGSLFTMDLENFPFEQKENLKIIQYKDRNILKDSFLNF